MIYCIKVVKTKHSPSETKTDEHFGELIDRLTENKTNNEALTKLSVDGTF